MPTSHRSSYSRTRWSRVMNLDEDDAGSNARVLLELCQRYWYPVYAFSRLSGHPPAVAGDLCLAFFHHLPTMLREEDPRGQGRFRDFLLARLHKFLAGDWHQHMPKVSIPDLVAPLSPEKMESRMAADHIVQDSPEQGFQRSFALEVLGRSLRRLRLEAEQNGRGDMFTALQPFLAREPEPGQYQQLAQQMETPPLVLVIAVKRLRQRFRELTDDELMETVASPDDLENERSALLVILSNRSP